MYEQVDIGAHLKEILRRSGIKIKELAAKLEITDKAVWRQLHVPNPRRQTIEQYANAINMVLEERDDPRRFSADSLTRGPDPLIHGELQKMAVGLVDDKLIQQVATEIVRQLVTPAGTAVLQIGILNSLVTDDGQPDVTSENMVIPQMVVGHGANELNTFALRIGMYDDDMAGAGLKNSSLVVARRDIKPREDDIVVAHIQGKLVARRWSKGLLISEPTHGHVSVITQNEIISIIGVCVFVWIKLR